MGQFTFNVRLGTTGITPTALVERVRNHVTKLTGNPDFTTPTPTTVALTAACDALDAANQAYDFNRGKTEKQTRDAAFDVLLDMERELAGYVQANCKNDKELILSTGFDVRRIATPQPEPSAPGNVRALVTPYPGRLEVRWAAVPGRRIYSLFMTSGDPLDPAGWKLLVQTSKNRYTVEGLTSDKVYTFRLQTLAASGVSPMSDIAAAKAA